MNTLSPEMYWLTLTVLMTALFWAPYIVNRIVEQGAWATLQTPKLAPEAAWAGRLMRAHANAVENLAVFAPAVLAVQMTGSTSASTEASCMIYFFARLAHMLAYVAAVPVLRTLAFAAGFFCQFRLAMAVLGVF